MTTTPLSITTLTIPDYRIETIAVDDLSATDLRAEVERAAYEPDASPAEIARVWIEDKAEPAFAVYFPDYHRGGIAWGADAQWTDCRSLDDGIYRVLVGELIS